MVWIIFGIISALSLFVLLEYITKQNNTYVSKSNILLRVIASVVVFVIFSFVGCIKSVGPGEVGILYSPFNGGIQENTLKEGFHFTNPINKVFKINTTQQQVKVEPFSVQTQDSEYATFIVEVKYKISTQNAFKVYREFKGMPTIVVLQTDIQAAIKKYTIEYNIYDILGGKYELLRSQVVKDLKAVFESFGISLIEVNFIDIDAAEQIENAITQKGIIKQEKEQAEQRKQVAEIEQQRKLVEAETKKQEEIIKAEAEAEKIRIEAEAQAEAIRLIQEQLLTNPDYIEYIKWSKWDGKLPDVIAGSDASIIVDGRRK